jgi:dihydroorotase
VTLSPRDGLDVDLLIRAHRVVDPGRGLDAAGIVAISGDRIVHSGPEVAVAARRTVDLGDVVLLPGLVDLHGHPDRREPIAGGGSKYGVDPDLEFLPRGVTTVLSQGDAGAGDWPAYRAATVEPSRTRVLMALNLGWRGEAMEGPALEARDIDVEGAGTVAGGDGAIWGIAVNTSRAVTGGNDPRRVLRQAIAASELAGGLPLLFGSRREADIPLDEQLELLRPGDLFTYCYSGTPENILDDRTGRVRESVRRARERGILFDTGHGMMSFDFSIAERALADGFAPDTISTDQYRRHVGSQPQHDLPRTISKLLAAGMGEIDAFAAATTRPAAVLGLEGEIGTLAAGACADLVALRWNAAPAAQPLVDTGGSARSGGTWEPAFVVRAGEVVAP